MHQSNIKKTVNEENYYSYVVQFLFGDKSDCTDFLFFCRNKELKNLCCPFCKVQILSQRMRSEVKKYLKISLKIVIFINYKVSTSKSHTHLENGDTHNPHIYRSKFSIRVFISVFATHLEETCDSSLKLYLNMEKN